MQVLRTSTFDVQSSMFDVILTPMRPVPAPRQRAALAPLPNTYHRTTRHLRPGFAGMRVEKAPGRPKAHGTARTGTVPSRRLTRSTRLNGTAYADVNFNSDIGNRARPTQPEEAGRQSRPSGWKRDTWKLQAQESRAPGLLGKPCPMAGKNVTLCQVPDLPPLRSRTAGYPSSTTRPSTTWSARATDGWPFCVGCARDGGRTVRPPPGTWTSTLRTSNGSSACWWRWRRQPVGTPVPTADTVSGSSPPWWRGRWVRA